MTRGFCPRGFCPEGAYVLMELSMEGVLSEGVLSGGGFVLPSTLTHHPSVGTKISHFTTMLINDHDRCHHEIGHKSQSVCIVGLPYTFCHVPISQFTPVYPLLQLHL